MDEKTLAAKIYLNSKKIHDLGLLLLEILKDIEGKDTGKLLEFYVDIKDGKTEIVEVQTSIELSDAQKSGLEKKVQGLLSEKRLVFIYNVDPEISTGLIVRIGDSILDLTINNLIK